MQLRIGRDVFPVATLEEASARYERFRGGKPSSQMRDGEVVTDCGGVIARVSYNAKVWPPVAWCPGMEPLFNPYASSPELAR